MNPVQKLLVEGENDRHVIATLALVKGLPMPKGYEIKKKFDQEFITIGHGIDGIKKQIPTILKMEGLTNFGIVLDADVNAQSAWDSVGNILLNAGFQDIPTIPTEIGTILLQEERPKVGVWIMPDNRNEGYLESFLKKMIPYDDKLVIRAEEIVQELIDNQWNLFSLSKKTKAEIHTWLAWQTTPGMPMGMSLSAKYFDTNAPSADIFITWLQQVFEFQNLSE